MTLAFVPDAEEMEYITYVVFPSEQSADFLNNRELIHYEGLEPTFGDRFDPNAPLPDFYGNSPDSFYSTYKRGSPGSSIRSAMSQDRQRVNDSTYQQHVNNDDDTNFAVAQAINHFERHSTSDQSESVTPAATPQPPQPAHRQNKHQDHHHEHNEHHEHHKHHEHHDHEHRHHEAGEDHTHTHGEKHEHHHHHHHEEHHVKGEHHHSHEEHHHKHEHDDHHNGDKSGAHEHDHQHHHDHHHHDEKHEAHKAVLQELDTVLNGDEPEQAAPEIIIQRASESLDALIDGKGEDVQQTEIHVEVHENGQEQFDDKHSSTDSGAANSPNSHGTLSPSSRTYNEKHHLNITDPEVVERLARLHLEITPESVMHDIPTHYDNSGHEIPHWQRIIMARKRAEKLIADEEQRLIEKADADQSY